ncbi:hypothetical protein SS1G_05693 [Sclerotinia sclerotiorum 1980 UF-70]|uniref:Uncharacterized protein n=1 Tax=Sclerotinia sclerotiorum (strain ATCC 18683 / 1980 / Ss-1) TaxID=665079 RepID=A7EK47_SCLS1|nr:hypothetical protein SS1G_05693 [Sclerotinia sclerotiorum 1980 UF-70]EDO03213.1 hypothetical protein SS1G_05693 [Sclerotinia sclerotiorum 1980 UF-70]
MYLDFPSIASYMTISDQTKPRKIKKISLVTGGRPHNGNTKELQEDKQNPAKSKNQSRREGTSPRGNTKHQDKRNIMR